MKNPQGPAAHRWTWEQCAPTCHPAKMAATLKGGAGASHYRDEVYDEICIAP